jgi:hypothetical protein
MHIHMHMLMSVFVSAHPCVCVCVCVQEDISARGQGMVDSLKESPREYLRRALQKDKAKR